MAKKPELDAMVVLAGKIHPSLKAAMRNAESHSNKMGGSMTKAMNLVKKASLVAAAGIAAAGAALVKTTVDTVNVADKIDKMSIRTGLTYEQLQKLDYMTSQVGVDFDSLGNSIAAMTRNMKNSDKEGTAAAQAFKLLNVNLKSADGQLRSQGDVFSETVAALAQMQNETERNALAMRIFGKGANEMIPLYDAGVDGLRELSGAAEKYGMIMSDDMIKTSVKVKDTMDTFKRGLIGVRDSLIEQVLPYAEKFANYLIDNLPQIQEKIANLGPYIVGFGEFLQNVYLISMRVFNFINRNWSIIEPLILGIVAAMTAWKLITIGMQIYKGVMAGIRGATLAATASQWALNAAVLANPMTWIVLGIAVAIGILVAGIYLLVKHWDAVSSAMSRAWVWFKNLLKKIPDFALALAGPLAPLLLLIKHFDKLKNLASGAIGSVKKFFGLGGKGKSPDDDLSDVPKFARGGFTNRPSIFGEAGPEAAIPLKRTPRSLGLLNRTAQALGVGGSGAGGISVILNYSPSIKGSNAEEMERFIRPHADEMIALIEQWLEAKRREEYA